jgi:XTP/dITP diphosphohydrolase
LRRSLLIGLSIRKAGKQEKKMDLLLATRNRHKSREFRELLGHDFEVIDLSSFPEITMPEETGRTFKENATLKAIAVSRNRPAFAKLRRGGHLLVVADDSGLEVDALGSAPGIYSARYGGENASDAENIDKLLRELGAESVAAEKRSARFRCVIALAQNGKLLGAFEGVVEGSIVDPPRGTGGFGYDPVFQPNGFDQTFGEMSPESKNKISHRGKSIAALREALRDIAN